MAASRLRAGGSNFAGSAGRLGPRIALLASTALTPVAMAVPASGQAIVNAGSTYTAQSPGELSSSLIVNGTLFLNGKDQTVSALGGGGNVYNDTTSVSPPNTAPTFNFSSSSSSNTTAPATLTLFGAGTSFFDGNLADAVGRLSPGLQLSLTIGGPGTLVLSGNNSYSGTTNIENVASTLILGSTSALSPNSALQDDGALILNGYSNTALSLSGAGNIYNNGNAAATLSLLGPGSGHTTTFSGSIADNSDQPNVAASLGLTLGGQGTLILSGVNTYSGDTTINGGTLVLGSTSALSANSALQDDGILILNGYSNTALSLSGAGNIYNNGNAAATLSLLGPGSGHTTTFSGSIADNSDQPNVAASLGLTLGGQGTLILSGVNTYSGDTTINGSTLDVAGTTAKSEMLVNSGGNLIGSGSIGGDVQVNAGGTLSPGDSGGKSLKINGSLTFQENSAYHVWLTPIQTTSTQVSGRATLSSRAQVRVDEANGTYKSGTTYNILSANGGVVGTFSNQPIPDLLLLDPQLSYDNKNVYLSLGTYAGALPKDGTPNQSQLGNYLDNLPSNVASSLQFLIGANASNVGSFITTLNGFALHTAPTVSLSNNQIGTLIENAQSCRTLGQSRDANVFVREGQCYWGRVTGSWVEHNDDADSHGFHGNDQMLSTGGQLTLGGPWFAGAALSHDTSHVDTANGGRSDGTGLAATGILKYNSGPVVLSGALGAAKGWFNNQRQVIAGGSTYTASSDSSLNVIEGRLTGAYLVSLGQNVYVKPKIDVSASHIDLPGYTEAGTGGIPLVVSDSSNTIFSLAPSIEFGNELRIPGFGAIRSFIKGGVVVNDKGSITTAANLAAAPTGTQPFTATSDIDKTLATATFGTDMVLESGTVLRLQYDAKAGDQTKEQSGSVKLSLPF